MIVVQHLKGSRTGQTQTFEQTPLTMGRDPSNLLAFDPEQDLDVSSAHAVINRQAHGFELVDLGSTNGTYLNGQRVQGTVALGNPSVIGLGKDGVRLQVSFQQAPRPMAMVPAAPVMRPMPLPVQPQRRGPGHKTRMIQDLSRKQTGTRRLMIGFGVLSVLCVGLGLFLSRGYFSALERGRAEDAETRALSARRQAVKAEAGGLEASGLELARAERELERGREAMEESDYEESVLAFLSAEFGFEEARDLALSAKPHVETAPEEDRRNRELEAQLLALERALAEAHQARIDALHPSDGDTGAPADAMVEAEADHQAALEAVRSAREVFAELVAKSPWVVCRLSSTPWLMRGSSRVLRLGAAQVGMGVFLTGDRIITTKRLARPHLHIPEFKAAWMQYLRNAEGSYQVRVETRVEVLVPLADDDGLSSAWRVLFQTDDGSLELETFGREDVSELSAAQDVEIEFEQRPVKVEGVQVYAENGENWAVFRYDAQRAFRDTAGRQRLKEVAGGLAIEGQELGETTPRPLDAQLLLGIESGGLKSTTPSILSTDSDGSFLVDTAFRPSWQGGPVFDGSGRVVGLVVGAGEGGLRAIGLQAVALD